MKSANANNIRLFGIRHHGPGSSLSLIKALEALKPDCVLIEGPREAEPLTKFCLNENLQPPVALLSYAVDSPRKAAYYPLAEFSPEWQAIKYATANGIPIKFIDLPQTNWLALNEREMSLEQLPEQRQVVPSNVTEQPEVLEAHEIEPRFPGEIEERERELQEDEKQQQLSGLKLPSSKEIRQDPIGSLAKLAGFNDGEKWWEEVVENQVQTDDIFESIATAMGELRSSLEELKEPEEVHTISSDQLDLLREAHMRQCLRQALKAGHKSLAVVCGAWHTPALDLNIGIKEDTALLKGLPKIKTETTWIPWTHSRMQFQSGYGAGVNSPGWYQHIFDAHGSCDLLPAWFAKVAHLLREEELDASSAQLIDALRLAQTLTDIRGLSKPGLEEVNDAIITALMNGESIKLQLIHDKLIVGEKLGTVPEDVPTTPLTQDLHSKLKSLRIKPDAQPQELRLDLRKSIDLERSLFLRRLNILEIHFGEELLEENLKRQMRATKTQAGQSTFHEDWQLQWHPELSLRLIEASVYGRTIDEAASQKAIEEAGKLKTLKGLVELISELTQANLTQALNVAVEQLAILSATTGDVQELLAILPPMAKIYRYGSVRGSQDSELKPLLKHMALKAAINLPQACYSLDLESSQYLNKQIHEAFQALGLIQEPEITEAFNQALLQMTDIEAISGLIKGSAVRLLFSNQIISPETLEQKLAHALSHAQEPSKAALWLEGFLYQAALTLIHDRTLLSLIDQWLNNLNEEHFLEVLPLLRRTFSTYEEAEQRQIIERLRLFKLRTETSQEEDEPRRINLKNAQAALETLNRLFYPQATQKNNQRNSLENGQENGKKNSNKNSPETGAQTIEETSHD
jgi:hypothetical protein